MPVEAVMSTNRGSEGSSRVIGILEVGGTKLRSTKSGSPFRESNLLERSADAGCKSIREM
jgi:hypothetical protein